MEISSKIPTSSHGVRFTFTSKQVSHYTNNSLNKTQYISRLQKSHLESLEKETKKISTSKQYHNDLRTRISKLKTDQSHYKQKLKEIDDNLENQNKAAVIIQKFTRGFLLRKKIDEEWYAMKKVKLVELVTEMDNSHDRFLFAVGKMPNIAAVVIQRAVRRHFFYKKIMRIKKVYLHMLELKEQETYRLIRTVIRTLYCTKLVKTLKFEKYKIKRLAAIKNKLALLTIKIVFAREKLSWKIVRIRIRKFKRNMKVPAKKPIMRKGTLILDQDKTITKKVTLAEKKIEIVIKKPESPERSPKNLVNPSTSQQEPINSIQNPPISTTENKDINQNLLQTQSKDQLLTEGQFLQPSPSQETIVTTTTEKEERAREEFLRKLEAERKEKVALGKISYGVRNKDQERLLPYLKTFSGIEPEFSISNSITLNSSSNEKKKKLIVKNSESLNKQTKRKYISGSYMNETKAFQFARMEPDDFYTEEEPTHSPSKVRNNSTLMLPTAAFIQKTSGNPSARSHSTETKVAEKLIIVSKKFRSNILLEIPEKPEKSEKQFSPTKKIPVLLHVKQPQPIKIEVQEVPALNNHRVSISFTEALPEYSEFLTQYTRSPRKSKLDPILPKSNKIHIFDSQDL